MHCDELLVQSPSSILHHTTQCLCACVCLCMFLPIAPPIAAPSIAALPALDAHTDTPLRSDISLLTALLLKRSLSVCLSVSASLESSDMCAVVQQQQQQQQQMMMMMRCRHHMRITTCSTSMRSSESSSTHAQQQRGAYTCMQRATDGSHGDKERSRNPQERQQRERGRRCPTRNQIFKYVDMSPKVTRYETETKQGRTSQEVCLKFKDNRDSKWFKSAEGEGRRDVILMAINK